jgi:mannose-6-phosphate isomerase-like protein (cupin superfamily)
MARAGDELLNRLTGERIVFVKTAADTGGELLEMDDFWTQPGRRANEHVHPGMQEHWEVLAGTACFRIAGVEQTAGPGELVVAAPGVPHLAWNPGEQLVHLRVQMRPALRWEQCIERLFALSNDAYSTGSSVPDPSALHRLLREFPREIIPAPISQLPIEPNV